MEIKFAGEEHKARFELLMQKASKQDSYHAALFFALSLSPDTARNIGALFDFKEDCIIPEGLKNGFQTGGTARLTRFAFNLWNGFTEEGEEEAYTPYNLFDCSFAPFMFEAIKLRYPEYCR